MKHKIKFIGIFMTFVIVLLSLTACNGSKAPSNDIDKPSDNPNTVSVTFPEGYTIIDIAEKLEANNVCKAEDFLAECNKPRDGIEIDNPSERVFLLEGYVFPDTYEFYFNSSASNVLDKFIANYNVKFTDEMRAKAKSLGYTEDEIITLASIIQKECDRDIAECAAVSSVFHNRLKSPSFPLLQSDVTTFYIKNSLGEYLGYLPETELEKQSEKVQNYMQLYSTYYCKGLPAGPICNPGIKAVNAALNPADTDYYYFLTDDSGENFYYAATLAEHQANGKKAGLF